MSGADATIALTGDPAFAEADRRCLHDGDGEVKERDGA